MNPPPKSSYHQSETVFTGERQEFADTGLSPNDPTVQGRGPGRKPTGAQSESPQKKKRKKRN